MPNFLGCAALDRISRPPLRRRWRIRLWPELPIPGLRFHCELSCAKGTSRRKLPKAKVCDLIYNSRAMILRAGRGMRG
jgi:hypothetical protein